MGIKFDFNEFGSPPGPGASAAPEEGESEDGPPDEEPEEKTIENDGTADPTS
jgi:hypothetical protein